MAYIGAHRRGQGFSCCVVLDGVEQKNFETIGDLVFSPDSARLAYVAKQESRWSLILDGKQSKSYDGFGEGSLRFSSDSRRIAFIAKTEQGWVVVVDGQESKLYEGIGEMYFLRGNLLFQAFRNRNTFVVDNGVEGPEFPAISSLTVSSDGTRYAYVGRRGATVVAVIDNKEEAKGFDMITELRFSPDGRRYAYVGARGAVKEAQDDGRQIIVDPFRQNKVWVTVNGNEAREEQAEISDLSFSPDGKHTAYLARRGGSHVLGVPDSRRPLSFQAAHTGEWFLVVDHSEFRLGQHDFEAVPLLSG